MKTINLQRAIIVDLDWLEGEISRFVKGREDWDRGMIEAFEGVKINSIPASKVAEMIIQKGFSVGISDQISLIEKGTIANVFINSPIQIEE